MECAELWSTLWVDVQAAKFGPPSYRGAPRLYRLQAWVSQPAQSIQLFGLLAGGACQPVHLPRLSRRLPEPAVGIVLYEGSRRHTRRSARKRRPAPDGLPFHLHRRHPARLFPRRPPRGRGSGRQALVVDWRDQYGQRRLRLWIDTRTGLLLRQQEFGGDDFNLLLSDIQVTGLALDQPSPPEQLATAMQKLQKAPATPEKGSAATPVILLPTPTAAVRLENRASLGQEPAPPGYDPRHARLEFEFPNNLDIQQRLQRDCCYPDQSVRRPLLDRRDPLRSALDAALRPLARRLAAGLQHLQRRRFPAR